MVWDFDAPRPRRVASSPGAARRRTPDVPTGGGTAGGRLLELQALVGNRATVALLGGAGERGAASVALAGAGTAVQREIVVQRGDDDDRIDRLIEVLKGSTFFERPENEVQAGFDLWLSGRAGNVHDIDVTKSGPQAAGEVSGGVGLGAYGRGAVSGTQVTYPLGLTVDQYQALAELGAFIGVEGKASGQVYQKLGAAHARALANIKGFAGAVARARASGGITMVDGCPFPVGFSLAGSASAMAGAKASGDAELTFGFSPSTLAGVGLGAEADFAALAGAEAKAEGKLEFDILRARVSASGAASAFAGVSIEGSVGGSAKLYGRKLLTLRAKGAASAGAGGKAEGGFSLSGGKITLKVSGMGALGGGLGAGSDFETDFKPLAVFIWRQAAKAQWRLATKTSDAEVRAKLANYDQALDADVRPRLEEYRDLKLAQLRMNDATNYVKIEKVQAILDWNWPRAMMSKYAKPHIANIDAAIVRLLKQVFEAVDPNLPVTIDVEVRKGSIKSLQTTPRELHVLLGGGIEGRHAHGRHAAKSNLLSDVGK